MKVGLWKKHGRIPLGLVIVGLIGLAVRGRLWGDVDADDAAAAKVRLRASGAARLTQPRHAGSGVPPTSGRGPTHGTRHRAALKWRRCRALLERQAQGYATSRTSRYERATRAHHRTAPIFGDSGSAPSSSCYRTRPRPVRYPRAAGTRRQTHRSTLHAPPTSTQRQTTTGSVGCLARAW